MKKIITPCVVFLILGTSFISISQGTIMTDDETEYWAVIISINDYENDKYDLIDKDNILLNQYRVYNATLSAKNWGNENVIFLKDENATKKNITKALDWLKGNSDENDVVFFFYSGHGAQIPDDNGDEEDEKDETICPYDINVTAEKELVNFLTDDELGEYFNNIDCKGMFLAFESCHSGGLFYKSADETTKKMEINNSINNFNDKLSEDINGDNKVILIAGVEEKASTAGSFMSLFLSSALDPSIGPEDDLVQSLFSFSLFRKDADRNKDNIITAEEISIFVKRKVLRHWTLFLLIFPVIKRIVRIIFFKIYREYGFIPSLIPRVYDGYNGDLPIVEL